MGLIRLLVILIIAWLVYSMTRRWLASLEQKKAQRDASRIETMVSCAHCGLHIPQKEALQAQGKYFCSEEHRKLSQSS